MKSPIVKARLRPIIEPILPPVTISIAITSVYSTMALWIPVTVVCRSSATVAIETFMTELSSAIRNWPAASVRSTAEAPFAARASVASTVMSGLYPAAAAARRIERPRTRIEVHRCSREAASTEECCAGAPVRQSNAAIRPSAGHVPRHREPAAGTADPEDPAVGLDDDCGDP